MRVEIEVRARFANPFNVGSGAEAGSFAERPTLRDKDGWPFIPASSLKGRLRHECERLAKHLLGERWKEYNCHPPRAESMCQEEDKLCPACRIFGSPWRRGLLHFSDLSLAETEKEKIGGKAPSPTIRYGVSLSRHRRVAEEDRLFTTEVFLPGWELELVGRIEGDLEEKELALVLAGLRAIAGLGGGKTGGLGWCRLSATPYRILADGSRQKISDETFKEGLKGWGL
ncbi:MAG: RAMP superfamily CRISPR-associated protein [Anaerolineae bacterium]